MLTLPLVFSAGAISILKVKKGYELLYDYESSDTKIWFRPAESIDPHNGGLVCAFASVEVSCTIIAASIPFFRPLIRRLMTKEQGRNTPDAPVVMSSLPISCRGHARIDSTSDSCRRTARDDDSVAIKEFESKL